MELVNQKQYEYLLDGAAPSLSADDKSTINSCVKRLDDLLRCAEDTRESSAAERMTQAVNSFTEKPSKAAVELVRTCSLEVVTGDQVATAIRKACDEVAVTEGRKMLHIIKVALDGLIENVRRGVDDYIQTVTEKANAIGMPVDRAELDGRLARSIAGYEDRVRKLDADPARAFAELESLGYAQDPRNNYVV